MRPKKIGVRSPLRVPAVSAKKTVSMTLLIDSLKSKGKSLIAKMVRRHQDEGCYQLLYKQVDDEIFVKIYLASDDIIVVKDGCVGQRLMHWKYNATERPRIQAEIEINKAKGYVSLSENEMDVLDVSMPINTFAAAEVEFIRAELSAFLIDSALGFYRGQQEDNTTATFTFSVVEYETARVAIVNFIRDFSASPICHVRRSAQELADLM